MKRPAFQFYPGDWLRDSALRASAVAARGLWIDMLCFMHQSEPYGYLMLNGNPIDVPQLSRMVGANDREVKRSLAELESAGVFSRDDKGVIFSRRMVKDEYLRGVRGEAGKLGGNPQLLGRKVNQNPEDKVNQSDNQTPTPSSSTSSSSSEKSKAGAPRGTRLDADWLLPKAWGEWALTEQPTWTPDHTRRVAEKFKDHWLAIAGSKGVKLTWEATWRNWVRNEGAMKLNGNHSGPAWWSSNEGITAKAKEIGLSTRAGEGYADLKARVSEALEQQARAA